MCEAAVSSSIHALPYVPEALHTPDLYRKAMVNDPAAIQMCIRDSGNPAIFTLEISGSDDAAISTFTCSDPQAVFVFLSLIHI